LTSVELPFGHAMCCAVDDIIDLIEGRESTAYRELPSRLVVRGSTNPSAPAIRKEADQSFAPD